jgi:hypothetical protein
MYGEIGLLIAFQIQCPNPHRPTDGTLVNAGSGHVAIEVDRTWPADLNRKNLHWVLLIQVFSTV